MSTGKWFYNDNNSVLMVNSKHNGKDGKVSKVTKVYTFDEPNDKFDSNIMSEITGGDEYYNK